MGGTFDPVHHAHLILAERAYEQYALDEIWMLPNGNPPHKRDTRQADMECRMEMLRLAIQNIPYLKLCDMERSASAYHYTYETLQRLNEQHPDTVFYFIMGADSLFEFDNWKEPGIISRECILLAAVTAGGEADPGAGRAVWGRDPYTGHAQYGYCLCGYPGEPVRRKGSRPYAAKGSGNVYPAEGLIWLEGQNSQSTGEMTASLKTASAEG